MYFFLIIQEMKLEFGGKYGAKQAFSVMKCPYDMYINFI